MAFELVLPQGARARVVRPGSRVRVTFGRYGGGERDVEIAYIMGPLGHKVDELDLDAVVELGFTLTPKGAPLSNGRYSIWPYPEAAVGPVVVHVGGKDILLTRDVFDKVEVIPEPGVPSLLVGTVDRVLLASPDDALRVMALRFAPGTPERARVDAEIERRTRSSP